MTDNMSIRTKVILYLSLFCIVLFGMLWILQVTFLPQVYQYVRQKQAHSLTDSMESELMSRYVAQEDSPVDPAEVVLAFDADTADRLKELSESYDAGLMVFGRNGTAIYSADGPRNSGIRHMPYGELEDLLAETEENGEVIRVYADDTDMRSIDRQRAPIPSFVFRRGRSQSIILCRAIVNDGQTVAYVIVDMQLTPVESITSAIRYSLYVVILVMLLVGAVFSWYLSSRISKPIKAITEQSGKLASGNYDTVFDAKGYREINDLSRALTDTAAELGKVDQLRKDFIANVSHDLRTPLTLISGYAEVMRDVPGENNSENAQIIIDESSRLASLVNDVLELSRIQAGTLPMETTRFDIAVSVKDTVHRLNELLKNSSYSIDYEGPVSLEAEGDRERIGQCVYNLLLNAVNHTGDDGKVHISLVDMKDAVKVAVEDTGEGVSEEDMPYIWDRYYKVDKEHRRSVIGSGIGLSIVKSVVDAHNGKYGVNNRLEGGAEFWFEIPNK